MTNEQTKEQQVRERFGQRVAQLRKLKGMSQEQLAEAAGTHRSHINRIEAGKYNMTIETAQAIAEAFDMTLDIVDARLEGLAPLERLTNNE